MGNKLRAIRDATKENVDYISGLLGIGIVVVGILNNLYTNFFKYTLYSRVTILAALILFIYFFIRNLKKIIANAKLTLDVAENLYQAEHQASQLEIKRLIDFNKIIPATDVLKRLYIMARENAQKNLDPNCVLYLSYLDIHYSQKPSGRHKKWFTISAGFTFYSAKKKMTISEYARDLKMIKDKPAFDYRDIGYSTTPFFENEHWREALIEACERTEVHLIILTRFFINLVGYSANDIYISFYRNIPLSKTYAYSLGHNKLYEGSLGNNNPIVEFK